MAITSPRWSPALRIALFLALSAPLLAQTSGTSTASPPWIAVDTSAAASHLGRLSGNEKIEQLRDWALLSAYVLATPEDAPHREALLSVVPVRLDALSALHFRRVGETRALTLPDGRLVALLPASAEGSNRQLLLGRLLDEDRAAKGRIAPRVIAFEYQLTSEPPGASVRPVGDIASQALFKEEAGYFERVVTTAAELDRFLALNVDVTHARRQDGRLVLGGRRLDVTTAQLVTREDLAVLVQASMRIADDVRVQLRKRGLRAEYDRLVRQEANRILAERDASAGLTPFDNMLRLIREIEQVNPYEEFETSQIEHILASNPPSSGFSLDPRVNHRGIADDLDAALRGDDTLYGGWLLERTKADLLQQQPLMENKFETLLSAFRQFASADRGSPEATLRTLIGLDAPPSRATRTVEPVARDRMTEVTAEAEQRVSETRAIVGSRAEELRRVIASLRRGSSDALFDLERYVNAETVGLTMRPGAAAYRVRDLQEMLKDTVDATLAVDGQYGQKTTTALREFQEVANLKASGVVDDDTWKALLAVNIDKAQEIEALRLFLNALHTRNNFQCARYDGRLAGTRVGMTLFYTDVLMKLWSFANTEQTPPVSGFVSQTQYSTSPIYWEDENRYSSTRGWLGPRLEGFKFVEHTAVNFAPVATRLYNASSNPLISGKEVPATFGPERFSSWWNAHYAEVASFEPQFHRLNELMKWTVILTAFDDGVLPGFDGLTTMAVTRNLRFDQWWSANRESLKVAPLSAFRRVTGETTECMDILQSEWVEGLGGIYSMSGGVTLPERSAVKAKATADEARRDVSDLLRMPNFDIPAATVDSRTVRLPFTEGGASRGVFDLPRNSPVAEFRPAPQQQLGGAEAALSLESLTFDFAATGNGIRVKGQAGPELLFDVAVAKAGETVRVSYNEGDFFVAIDRLRSAEKRGDTLDGGDYLGLPERNQVLVRAGEDRWALVTRATSATSAPGTAVRLAIDEVPLEARPLSETEISGLTADYRWERLSGAFDPDAPVRAALATEAPPEARGGSLRVGNTVFPARFDRAGVYVMRDGPIGGAARRVGAAVRSGDLDALVSELALSGGTVATRGRSGELLILTAEGTSPADLDIVGQVLRSDASGQRVVIESEASAGVRVSTTGAIRVSRTATVQERAVAERVAQLIGQERSLAEPLSHLGALEAPVLDQLVRVPQPQRAAYVEFRGAPELLPGEVLADLRTATDLAEVMLKRGAGIEFLRPRSATASEIANQLRYVDDVMNPARADREGRAAVDPTVREFLENTRGLYAHLQEIAATTGGEKIVTLESGEVNLGTIWALHGGDPRVQFLRDQPDLHASVANARARQPLAIGASAVFVTAPLSSDGDVGRVPTLIDQVSRFAPVGSAATFDEFVANLDRPELSQIVLVAREQDGGLAFSDRWVSLREIEYMMADESRKALLVLVTNGGARVQQAFSDSGRFGRVLLQPFVLGQLDTFELALETVTSLLQEPGELTVTLDRTEFEEISATAGRLATFVAENSRADGERVHVDVPRLLQRAAATSADVEALVSLQGKFAPAMRPARVPDVDETVKALNDSRAVRTRQEPSRKARAEISAMVQVKYE